MNNNNNNPHQGLGLAAKYLRSALHVVSLFPFRLLFLPAASDDQHRIFEWTSVPYDLVASHLP